MVMTVLEARVSPERVGDLERAYRAAGASLPPGIVETFLARDVRDAGVFRIVTIWESRGALEAMRASEETPKGIVLFQEAGASPEISIFEVLAHHESTR